MEKIYNALISFSKFLLNMLFVLQITLMILVFLTATYWFLHLINVSSFDFVAPVADSISSFVRMFYKDDIQAGGMYIDGSLLLFDIIALIIVFLISKVKFYVRVFIDVCELSIKMCKDFEEEEFNKKLQKETEEQIKKYNNVAILVKLETKNMFADSAWGDNEDDGVKEKEEEAFKIFYASIKNISGCKFAKTDNKMLIMLNDFSKIDNLLNFVDLTINRIRENMKKKKWILSSYVAVEVYSNDVSFKKDIYPVLENLLTLHHKNQALCLGNFNLRYKLLENPLYKLSMRGAYDIVDGNVYSLVKKN